MKKIIKSLLVACSVFLGVSPVYASEEKEVLKVASHLPDMIEVVEVAADNIKDPYEIELYEVSDNIQYNEAVQHDEAFASFAEHKPFMELYNQERNGTLVEIQPIYNAIVGFYSPTIDKIEDLEDGAEIAIPNDPSNEARALMILDDYGLIKLKEGVGYEATIADIEDNPHNYKITSVDLLNLTSSYEDGVDLVFSYPAYISKLGLSTKDAVILENDTDETFAQTLVVKEENADTPAAKALIEAFTCQEVYDLLEERLDNGNIIISFENPSAE